MNHLSEETLSALLDGEVEREAALAAEAHLGECHECRNALEGMRRTAALLGRLERIASPDHLADEVSERVKRRTVIDAVDRWHVTIPIPKPRPFWMSAAASVVLMVVLVYLVARMDTWKPPGEEPEVAGEVSAALGSEEVVPHLEEEKHEGAPSGEAAGRGQVAPPDTPGPAAPPSATPARGEKGAAGKMRAAPGAALEEERDEAAPVPAEEMLASEDRRAVATEQAQAQAQPQTRGRPSPNQDAWKADFEHVVEPSQAPATMEVGETRVRLVKDGEDLGELHIRFGGVQAGGAAPGIRILCDPEGGSRYGSEGNPVQAEREPDGFQWPMLEGSPEVFGVGGDRAAEAGAGGAGEKAAGFALDRARPAPVPPPITFSLEGKMVVDREGRARFSGVPPWLAGPLGEVTFRAGRCASGEAAAVEVPFEAEWKPAD